MKDYSILMQHIKNLLNNVINKSAETVAYTPEEYGYLKGGENLSKMLLNEIEEFEKLNA